MTITWTAHPGQSYLDFVDVLYGTVTASDASHVTITSGELSITLDGTFAGGPPTGGTVTGFHLYRDGVLMIEATGHSVSYQELLAAMSSPLDNLRPDALFFKDGDMVVNGSSGPEELFGGAFNDKVLGQGGNDFVSAGEGDDFIKGGGGDDQLLGGDGNDKIKGGGGDDLLAGSAGKDLLIGGRGDDSFGFGHEFLKGDVDRIKAFDEGHDTIELFMAVAESSRLAKGQFHEGSNAHDADDLVIYDAKSGSLFIDLDGAVGEAQVKFAKVAAGTELSHKDFELSPLG